MKRACRRPLLGEVIRRKGVRLVSSALALQHEGAPSVSRLLHCSLYARCGVLPPQRSLRPSTVSGSSSFSSFHSLLALFSTPCSTYNSMAIAPAPYKMSGLSLWLSPAPSSPLAAFLARLSSTLQTVAFAPHATLVSDEIVPALELGDLQSRIEEGVARWRESQAVGDQLPDDIALAFQDVRQGEL
jgi:hypothetical protein